VIDIPAKQYEVFWRHSPKTLLGTTEFGGWVLAAARLPAEQAKKADETSEKFWPELASAFQVYCTQDVTVTFRSGRLTLPDTVKVFFDGINNYHLFITSFERSEVRIYPIKVWLEEWARVTDPAHNLRDNLRLISV
jgi:hypothetical protein